MKLIKEFTGNSKAQVRLVDRGHGPEVLKTNINSEHYQLLAKAMPFNSPAIYEIGENYLYMEYLPGMEMTQFITSASKYELDQLIAFLRSYIDWSFTNSYPYDFTTEIEGKIDKLKGVVDVTMFADMPRILPKSVIHGDLTLENIIYYNNRFYFIDFHPTNLSSIQFDVCKLLQDVDSLWFARSNKNKLNCLIPCKYISQSIRTTYPKLCNKATEMFMLSRILPYCKNEFDDLFLRSAIANVNSNTLCWQQQTISGD